MLRKIATAVTYLYIKGLTRWALRSKEVKYQAESTNNVYTSITDLPFDRFIKFHVEHDLSALFKTDDDLSRYAVQLIKLGQKITEEFTEACGADAAEVLHVATVAKLQSKIYRIEVTIEALKLMYNENLVADLKAMGIATRITQENLLHDLERATTEKTKFELQLKNVIKRYEENKPKKQPLDPASEMLEQKKMYYSILAAYDAKIEPEHISTMKFTVIYNKVKERAKNGTARANK